MWGAFILLNQFLPGIPSAYRPNYLLNCIFILDTGFHIFERNKTTVYFFAANDRCKRNLFTIRIIQLFFQFGTCRVKFCVNILRPKLAG